MYATQLPPEMQPGTVRRSSKRARRRRTLQVLMVLIVAVVVLFAAPRAVETFARSEAPALGTYTVMPGDTLWDIAEQFRTGGDVRQVVDAIRQANHLKSATVYPGQVLVIPQTRQVAAR